MDKNGNLQISNFQAGIADSPLLGFANMNNVDIFEKPGVVKIQFGASLSFSTASLPVAMVYDSIGNQYVGCKEGQIYKNGSLLAATTSLTSGGYTLCDIKIISDGTLDSNNLPKEYLFITTTTDTIGFYGPTYSGSAGGFFLSTGSLATSHKQIAIGIDTDSTNQPIVYFGNGNKVATIKNFVASVPGVSPTYDVNYSALTLQPGHYAYSINNLGKYLAIGTIGINTNLYGPINSKTSALILWDRTSPTFNLPIFFKENGVTSLLQMENRLYCAIGNRGRIFLTDGTNFQQVKRIPFIFNRQFGGYAFVYPNAMTLHNGDILTGISGYNVNGTYGVYSSSLTETSDGQNLISYPTIMRNSPSTGSVGNSQTLNIGMLYSTGIDELYIGWQDGNTYGVDVITSTLATGYISKIESKYYNIGDRLNQHTFKRMEVACSSPLIEGQSIRISYRTDPKDDYTVIGTYTSTDFGTENSINKPANLAKIIDLQILIEMTQDTDVEFGNNIELISVSFTSSEK